ncbi:MAG: helix-turn-helix domain-containing protein [Tildeniella nuda ZEHNDER 1965/U140]|jgi:addiction module HigA family antidote|nr:helix-turn-helix domain-containing protein [Tildeniella nuda ZEHNDER 1965/U140]
MSSATRNQYNPDYVSPPGDTLLEVLEERGMSQAELAERTGRPRKTINEIINGKTAITPDTALQFERVLGIPAKFWSQREQHYQDFLARQREKDRLEKQSEWAAKFPFNDMAKLSWVEPTKDKIQRCLALLNFFAVASPEQWHKHWENRRLAYRKSVAFESDAPATSVWLRKGELEAEKVTCQPYNATKFRKALDEIRALTVQPQKVFLPRIVTLCAEAGVVVVFVPELPKTRVSGVTRWLTPTKPLIQMSFRYKSNDHFWFTFFHESKHVLQENKDEIFLEGSADYDPDSPMEQEANQFSADHLIPPVDLEQFIARHRRFSKVAIEQFAAEIDIAPGIVVGRLQHHFGLPHDQCNELKQRIEWV